MKLELIYGHNPQDIFIWKQKYDPSLAGTLTVAQVVADSKVAEIYHLNLDELGYAIFDRKAQLTDTVVDGDRVAVLRQLPRRNQTNRRRK